MVIVALTDTGRWVDEVAAVFGLTATYVSLLRGRARRDGFGWAGPWLKRRTSLARRREVESDDPKLEYRRRLEAWEFCPDVVRGPWGGAVMSG